MNWLHFFNITFVKLFDGIEHVFFYNLCKFVWYMTILWIKCVQLSYFRSAMHLPNLNDDLDLSCYFGYFHVFYNILCNNGCYGKEKYGNHSKKSCLYIFLSTDGKKCIESWFLRKHSIPYCAHALQSVFAGYSEMINNCLITKSYGNIFQLFLVKHFQVSLNNRIKNLFINDCYDMSFAIRKKCDIFISFSFQDENYAFLMNYKQLSTT